jgi:thymidylate kinase
VSDSPLPDEKLVTLSGIDGAGQGPRMAFLKARLSEAGMRTSLQHSALTLPCEARVGK